MKNFFLILICVAISYQTTYAMWGAFDSSVASPDNEVFDTNEGEKYSGNYHKLYSYLTKFIDKPKKNDELALLWKSANIDTLSPSCKDVFDWIDAQADNNGNIVCLYLSIRNYLKYCTQTIENINDDLLTSVSPTQQEHFKKCFTRIMLLFMRTTFDIVNHYSIHNDTSVFNAYTIFKKKIQYLLHCYAKDTPIQNYPKIDETLRTALEHWYSVYGISENLFIYGWLSSFNWSHPWTTGSWGIWFGQHEQNTKEGAPSKTIFSVVENKFSTKTTNGFEDEITISKSASWQSFFELTEFPLTAHDLTTQLQAK